MAPSSFKCDDTTPTFVYSTSSCSSNFTIARTTSSTASPILSSNSNTFRRRYYSTSRTSTGRAKSERLRVLAKIIIKDLKISSLKATWNENNVPNLKENPQTKQPMWLNHKINSDRAR